MYDTFIALAHLNVSLMFVWIATSALDGPRLPLELIYHIVQQLPALDLVPLLAVSTLIRREAQIHRCLGSEYYRMNQPQSSRSPPGMWGVLFDH